MNLILILSHPFNICGGWGGGEPSRLSEDFLCDFTFHLGFEHPLQDVALLHCPLSVAFLFLVVPSFLVMSSCHLLHGRPLDLFPLLGCHSVQRLVHLLPILAFCPAHLHFCFSVHSIMSIIFVLFLISEHSILSCSFRFNIFLCIPSLFAN